MSRVVYLNGAFLAEAEAKLPIFDRGLLFADAVYEGLGVLDGQVVDFLAHMARLRRSLGELAIPEPMSQDEIFAVLMRLIAENSLDEGFLYFHVTRGTADRDYLYPAGLTPNVFAFTQPQGDERADDAPQPISMVSTPDLRWARRDIKTSNLLGQVLAKTAAHKAGATEALMIDPEGFVTEGGAVSFFIVAGGAIVARPVSNDILHGITRQSMLAVAEARGMRVEARRITLAEVYAADEAFVTGASSWVQPVGLIDGRPIGDRRPGQVTLDLRADYLRRVRAGFYRPS
jgi:D-alanine transaminase